MDRYISLENISAKVAILRLNRPDAANALSVDLLNQFNDQLDALSNNDQLSCLIITGSGSKAFCAGADLKERRNMDDSQVRETVELIGNTFSKVEQLPMPTIAVMNGSAFGGGLELALSCDLRIISSSARVGLTETGLAIIPGAGGTQRLPRLIGKGLAKKMIFQAIPVAAEEAYRIGIVEEVVEQENLLSKALKLAEQIASNGPIALRLAKTAINKGIELPLEQGLVLEHELYLETLHTEDRIEGLQAFKEKRKPTYKGK